MVSALVPGAPGIYLVPEPPVRALAGVRMDVAAFVGVAPRGPARLPALLAPWAQPPRGPAAPTAALRSVAVPVESFDAYRRLYGGFEGPGLLPYAVAAFFEQGGRRAYVVRVVHDYGEGKAENDWGTAAGALAGVARRGGKEARLLARDEGSWGNRLRAVLSFRVRPLAFDRPAGTGELVLARDAGVPPGTLLRLWKSDGSAELRLVTQVREEWRPERPARIRIATLESPVTAAPARAEVVEAELVVTDGARDGIVRQEVHARLGLSPLHPRWMAAVLHDESRLVRPDPAWIAEDLVVADARLGTAQPPEPQFTCGRDRYHEIVPGDFFDDAWEMGDEQPRGGIHALAEVEEVSVVVVPDLYSPGPLAPEEKAEAVLSLAGPAFAPCVPIAAEVEPEAEGECPGGVPASEDGTGGELEGLRLDPAFPDKLDKIAEWQQRVIDLAEALERWVVLLDVPPGLNTREALDWRARFGSAWAAAYHPWLRVARSDDARTPLVAVPPSAFAAGIVARQEIAFGVPHGPANVVAVGPVSALDEVGPARHDELHQAHVNVFAREPGGLLLSAGRTLSRDPQWRQLSVRRLVSMLRRALQRQMQWTVFEPSSSRLRDELRRMLETYLKQLHAANAFRGRTPDESFFVRCDDELNPPEAVDSGRLMVHVGVAPAEPLEFIVLRLTRESDGTLIAEE